MRLSRLIFATLLVIVISTTYVFVKETTLGSRFHISNDSTQNVSVTAIWREKSRDFGTIEADSVISFTVRDEASMVFTVRFADGREIESKPIYFISGTTIKVSIYEDSVDVSHDIDT
jgi:hypothetical protein